MGILNRNTIDNGNFFAEKSCPEKKAEIPVGAPVLIFASFISVVLYVRRSLVITACFKGEDTFRFVFTIGYRPVFALSTYVGTFNLNVF